MFNLHEHDLCDQVVSSTNQMSLNLRRKRTELSCATPYSHISRLCHSPFAKRTMGALGVLPAFFRVRCRLSARRPRVTMAAEEATAVVAPHPTSVPALPLVFAIALRPASGFLARSLLKVVSLVFPAVPRSAESLLSPVPLLARPLPYFDARVVHLALAV